MADSFPTDAVGLALTLREFEGFDASVDHEQQGLGNMLIITDSVMRMMKDYLALAEPVIDARGYHAFQTFTQTHWQLMGELGKALEALHRQVDIPKGKELQQKLDVEQDPCLKMVYKDSVSKFGTMLATAWICGKIVNRVTKITRNFVILITCYNTFIGLAHLGKPRDTMFRHSSLEATHAANISSTNVQEVDKTRARSTGQTNTSMNNTPLSDESVVGVPLRQLSASNQNEEESSSGSCPLSKGRRRISPCSQCRLSFEPREQSIVENVTSSGRSALDRTKHWVSSLLGRSSSHNSAQAQPPKPYVPTDGLRDFNSPASIALRTCWAAANQAAHSRPAVPILSSNCGVVSAREAVTNTGRSVAIDLSIFDFLEAVLLDVDAQAV